MYIYIYKYIYVYVYKYIYIYIYIDTTEFDTSMLLKENTKEMISFKTCFVTSSLQIQTNAFTKVS